MHASWPCRSKGWGPGGSTQTNESTSANAGKERATRFRNNGLNAKLDVVNFRYVANLPTREHPDKYVMNPFVECKANEPIFCCRT
jgi:hypothetical protein